MTELLLANTAVPLQGALSYLLNLSPASCASAEPPPTPRACMNSRLASIIRKIYPIMR
jgi:hypothetical protein